LVGLVILAVGPRVVGTGVTLPGMPAARLVLAGGSVGSVGDVNARQGRLTIVEVIHRRRLGSGTRFRARIGRVRGRLVRDMLV
jgi:hypothetical protein